MYEGNLICLGISSYICKLFLIKIFHPVGHIWCRIKIRYAYNIPYIKKSTENRWLLQKMQLKTFSSNDWFIFLFISNQLQLFGISKLFICGSQLDAHFKFDYEVITEKKVFSMLQNDWWKMYFNISKTLSLTFIRNSPIL